MKTPRKPRPKVKVITRMAQFPIRESQADAVSHVHADTVAAMKEVLAQLDEVVEEKYFEWEAAPVEFEYTTGTVIGRQKLVKV